MNVESRNLFRHERQMQQVLAATVAAGVSSSFAATLGGVLFSIEITTLYYDLGNYLKAFIASVSGSVAVSIVRTIAEGSSAYIERTFSADEIRLWQYTVCALMGVLCGFLGPVYVNFRLHMLKLARKWGKHHINHDKERRWEYVRASTKIACLVATITAVLTYFPGEYTRTRSLEKFKNLLNEGDLPDTYFEPSFGLSVDGSIFVSLFVSIVITFITAALGTSVTVPSGDFIQTAVS
ncbi:unnamed protein product [Sphacelaria rigidula]